MRRIVFGVVCVVATLMTGCSGTKLPASVSGGLDRVFLPPPHAIRGATPVDQAWIDETIAVGVEVMKWEIKERPPGLDAQKPKPPVVKKKKKFREKIKDFMT